MNFSVSDWRARNMLNKGFPSDPMRFSISNYSTDASIDNKLSVGNIKTSLNEELIYNSFRSISEPLIQNLANSVSTVDEKNKLNTQMSVASQNIYYNSGMEKENMSTSSRGDSYGSLAGIAGFFSNVIGAISGAMFHRRPKSPVSQYYDCFDGSDESLAAWHSANNHDQNKNGWAEQCGANDNMNNCKTAAAHCEGKLNTVKHLLASKTLPISPKFRPRRPKKLFIEPGSVAEHFEDASPDDFVSVANEEYIEYFTVSNNHDDCLSQIEIEKTLPTPTKHMEITKVPNVIENGPTISQSPADNVEDFNLAKNVDNKVPEIVVVNTLTNDLSVNDNNIDKQPIMPEALEKPLVPQPTSTVEETDLKQVIITSCEEKMAKLKSLLNKRKSTNSADINASNDNELSQSKENPNSEPDVINQSSNCTGKVKELTVLKTETHNKGIPMMNHVKHNKNKHRSTENCVKSKQNIQDDILFANEIDSEHLSSSHSPVCSLERLSDSKSDVSLDSVEEKQYFNEIKGRFHKNSTTDSEDSFQIVFSDSPKHTRTRKVSDCESEDSFIVFEDSPDSCYTTNEVFGESDSENDSESELSDSGVEVCKLAHSFSKTVGDLTETSLYDGNEDQDELDCAVRTVCEEIPLDSLNVSECEDTKSGLLIDAAKKLKRKDLPPKKVSFSDKPPKVHVMRVWAFAARQARAGHWERHALDRERFKRRIADVDMAVSWVLKPQHRSRIKFQRFMPWWNAQRRKEAAEKKEKEEQERLKKIQEEEDRVKRLEAGIVEENSMDNTKEIDIDNIENLSISDTIDNVDKDKSIDIFQTNKTNSVATQNNVPTGNTPTGNKVTKENVNGKFIGGLKGKKEDLKLIRRNLTPKNQQNKKKVLTK